MTTYAAADPRDLLVRPRPRPEWERCLGDSTNHVINTLSSQVTLALTSQVTGELDITWRKRGATVT